MSELNNIIAYRNSLDTKLKVARDFKLIQQSEAFKKEAAAKWVLVKANFPRKKANELPKDQKEHNRKLAEKYNIEGSFPLVVVLDKNGKVLGKMGFKNVSPEEYIKMIHALEKK